METDIYVCIETATAKLVAIEIEPRGFVRKDDPYFRLGVKTHINQEFPPLGAIVPADILAVWKPHQVNANDRDALYKLEGPKLSTSFHIGGFKG